MESVMEMTGGDAAETMETLMMELCVTSDDTIPREDWEAYLVSYLRRHAEQTTNMFVLSPSTPAQYFHALRRQVNLPFRRPLIMLTPKFLLHHKPCTSALSDFGPGTFFNRIITDNRQADNTRHLGRHPRTGEELLVPAEEVRRVILCTGQAFYHLSRERKRRKVRDVVLLRLEQIAPFPHDLLLQAITRYRNAQVVWFQEEPKNMGAWSYVRPRLTTALKHYVGWPSKGTLWVFSFPHFRVAMQRPL
jgi:2-oxoglutarate dehydrogenase E1 component